MGILKSWITISIESCFYILLYQFGLASPGAALLVTVHGNARSSLIASMGLPTVYSQVILSILWENFYNLENNISSLSIFLNYKQFSYMLFTI